MKNDPHRIWAIICPTEDNGIVSIDSMPCVFRDKDKIGMMKIFFEDTPKELVLAEFNLRQLTPLKEYKDE